MYIDLAGFGSFGGTQDDWQRLIGAAHRGATPGLSVLAVLLEIGASPPSTGDAVTAWLAQVPSMTCAQIARSIGLAYATEMLCAAFDLALAVEPAGAGWGVIREEVRAEIAAAEALESADATCADRAIADGGGSVCTSADGAQQVRCYNPDTGSMSIFPSGSPCPPGMGGVPRSARTSVARRPGVQERTLVLPSRLSPSDGALGPTYNLQPLPTDQSSDLLDDSDYVEKTDDRTGMSRGTKIAIGVTGGLVVLLGVAYVVVKKRRG